MITITDAPKTSAETALAILQRHTDRGGVFIDLDRACDYRTYNIYVLRHKSKDFAKMLGRTSYEVLPDTVEKDFIKYFPSEIRLLKKDMNNPESKISCESKTLEKKINQGMFSKDAVTYLQHYMELSKLKKASTSCKAFLNSPVLRVQSYEGHRMVLAKPTWTILNTGRLASRSPSVQNIAKAMPDLITYPEGYTLLRYDSSQIEPRITWSYFMPDKLMQDLIKGYNDAYFGQLHFILMSDEEMAAIRRGDRQIKLMEITDDIKALRGDLKKLALIGTYDGGLEQFDPKLANGYKKRITDHPLRLEWMERVKAQVKAGNSVFYSAFGSPIIPKENSKYVPGTKSWLGHVERCGINNPIQATAADLMLESVYVQDKILRENSSGKSWIGYYKHDEGCTYLHDDDIDLKDAICGTTAYQVRDWIPIYNEVEVGRLESPNKEYFLAM